MSRSTEEQDSAKSRGRPKGLPKRWSAQRKAEVVLRLLRGEDIGEVSREIRVAWQHGLTSTGFQENECWPCRRKRAGHGILRSWVMSGSHQRG